jgi:CO/xanthine dehydrogenase Mo-binding subunit
MTRDILDGEPEELRAELTRRSFMQALGAGLLITVTESGVALGQRRGGRGGRPVRVAARVHINADGTFTVMTGKVEEGQGARAQITQAAAEELCVAADKVRLIMADSALVPDDGRTAGSQTTPRTIPSVRQGAATARRLLARLAADQWQVPPDTLQIQSGTITNPATKQTLTYADLAKAKDVAAAFEETAAPDVTVTPVAEWKVLGTPVARPNSRDIVTGAHRYPSDIARPNMLYGKVLRPPAYGATLEAIDLSEAQAMKDVVVVRAGEFVGCAAASTFRAAQALAALAKTATWKTPPQPSSKEIFTWLKEYRRGGGTPAEVEKALTEARKVVNATYEVAYIQHTPMEPRAATAEWADGKLTVWAGVDYAQGAQSDLARVFGIPADQVHVMVPDMGGGFGGKHTIEAGEEAARLAKAAGKPVAVHWTRAEEFTWAYFRPAAVIECKAGLDDQSALVAWDFASINPGGAAIDPPYRIPAVSARAVGSDSPLRQGAYRCLGATANNFARESFMDELAAAAGADPLEFRLAHLDNPRLRIVLETAAKQFDWAARKKQVTPELGVGLACGTEKNSVVAACVEVAIDRRRGRITVREVCEAFECGPIMNPANLLSQVQGCICMGLGGALTEEMQFQNGRILNASFLRYQVPHFQDVPKLDIHLIHKSDIPAAGAGETPIIAVAPALANAVCAATGIRIRSMPLRGGQLREG